MAREPEHRRAELASIDLVALLLRGCWASVPIGTIESLIENGRVVEFPTGHTVYNEAEPERLAVVLQGLLRVYLHASDGRQVTVRYVRPGDLLGVPALIGGPAPVFVQAVAAGAAFFFDIARVKRAAHHDASVAWALAEESVHRLYDILEELAGNAFGVGPPTRRTPSPRPRRVASDIAWPAHSAGESAGSREQCGFGSGSRRARPRGASSRRPRPNVDRPRGDS